MKKAIILVLIVLGLGVLYFATSDTTIDNTPAPGEDGAQATFRPNPSNATFYFEDGPMTLSQGKNERTSAPGAGLVEETTLTDHRAYGDLNGDGRSDAAVLLVRQGGASGVFVYVAGYVSGPSAYKGTNTIFLGDRINPQSISIEGEVVVVKYLDRGENEPMAAEPSIPQTKRLEFHSGELVEM